MSFFGLVHELVERRLQQAVADRGGADVLLHRGPKVTRRIVVKLEFGPNAYEIQLKPTDDNRLVFADETVVVYGDFVTDRTPLGSGHFEANLKAR